MTESYLTTDIIVIIVLFVVLVLIAIIAFFAHFYWTKIGVAEIWNTVKWSSMRSSFYRTMRRLSRASSGKVSSGRPFSAASAFSDDPDGSALPAPLRNKKEYPKNNDYSSDIQPSTTAKTTRQNTSNQIQPVSTISTNNSARIQYGSKIGEPLANTKIHNIHEYNEDSVDMPTITSNRF